MINAKVIKFSIVAHFGIFQDGKCIGEKQSIEVTSYPGNLIDLDKLGKEMETLIEQQYETQKTSS